jgi:hypothetical protein
MEKKKDDGVRFIIANCYTESTSFQIQGLVMVDFQKRLI